MTTTIKNNENFGNASQFVDIFLNLKNKPHTLMFHVCQQEHMKKVSYNDFLKHLKKARNLVDEFLKQHQFKGSSTFIFQTQNSYSSYLFSLAAIIQGIHVLFLPMDNDVKMLGWAREYFKAGAVVTDYSNSQGFEEIKNLPVLFISSELLFEEENKHDNLQNIKEHDVIFSEDFDYSLKEYGLFKFISIGHDGIHMPVSLCINSLVETANHFIHHVQIPNSISWNSFEAVPNSNPFSHLSILCTFLKKGIVGFPGEEKIWLHSYHLLQPTFFFTSSKELNTIQRMIKSELTSRIKNKKRTIGRKIEKWNYFVEHSKAYISDSTYHLLKNTLRLGTRLFAGKEFIKQNVGKLRFVVHGLSPAKEYHVSFLEKFGVPVLETYGITQGAGLLSANEFHSTQLHSIGSPLPHISFRLGQQSVLEYKVHSPNFEHSGKWLETGDIAQMTPSGYIITGRKRHLIKTLDGLLVSPSRLEKSLLGDNSMIADACVVGDKKPYLACLIVLTGQSRELLQKKPAEIREKIQSVVAQVNETLPRNITIKKFTILDTPFSEANGEKLSNGELNRLQILKTRADKIQTLYPT